jgi:hypothetical protein
MAREQRPHDREREKEILWKEREMRKTALGTNQTVQITTTTELQPHMLLEAEVFRGN